MAHLMCEGERQHEVWHLAIPVRHSNDVAIEEKQRAACVASTESHSDHRTRHVCPSRELPLSNYRLNHKLVRPVRYEVGRVRAVVDGIQPVDSDTRLAIHSRDDLVRAPESFGWDAGEIVDDH